MPDRRARFANALWHASARREARAFARACANVRGAQEALLLGIVRQNAGTDYGRRHGFASIRTWDDYRACVPLVAYDALRSDLARIASGAHGVLTAEPVRLLEPTSGTSAGSKLVPYTDGLRREVRRGLDVWIDDLFARAPDLKRGPAYWSVTPLTGGLRRSEGGLPIGFEDDAAYLGGLVGRAMQRALAVPTDAKRIADADAFRYATLRFLVGCAGLRLVSVWNPTFFSLLLDALPDAFGRLVDDVARGTLTPSSPLDPALHAALSRRLRPDPARSAALRRAGADPTQIWPHLGLVSAWADAAADAPARALAARLPHAAFQPKGLLATEALVTVPRGTSLHDAVESPGATLAVRSHAFEFLPDDDGASEGAAATTRLAHELSLGETVRVVVTTSGGLYRYRLGDRVRVVGFDGEAPRLVFVGRAGATVDLVGEKLGEPHVRAALDEAAPGLGSGSGFALVAPLPGEPPSYALFLDASLDASLDDDALRAVAERLDERLRTNVHYDGARRLGQLGPLRAFRVEEDGAAAFLRGCVARGQRLGDVKPTLLHRAPDWPAHFLGRFV